MPYPRELNLDQETEDRLITYLEDELGNHYAERSSHVEDLQRYQRDYWAKPTSEVATFPFRNAATIIIPLSAIAVEAVHARTMTTIFALDQLVSAKAIAADWEQAERAVERHLNYELMTQMRIRQPLGDCFLEAEKFGTMIGKVGYIKEEKWAVREVGGIEQDFRVVTKDGAQFDCVPDSRFLMSYAYKNPQTAPWCGEEHEASPYEVMMLEQSGLFRPGTILGKDAKLRTWAVQSNVGTSQTGGRDFDDTQRKLENTEAFWPKRIDWIEVNLAFNIIAPVGGVTDQTFTNLETLPYELVVHYHRPSRTLMSCRYNWNYDLRRPYRVGQYFPVEHRWRGIGICKQNEQFQKEITTQHRQRIDNGTLANMRMLKIHKMSGYSANEPIFPGKMWFVDSMDHIESFQMGEIYPSGYQNENASLVYSQQRTGANDVMLGMPQVGTPGTATSDMARIQEGTKKYDFIYSNFKTFTTDIITDVACTIQQFGPHRVEYYDLVENGQYVKQFYDMPELDIRNGLLISLKAAGQNQNKVLDRQNAQQIAQYTQQYYTGLLQLAQFTQNPKVIALIVTKGMSASTEVFRQILDGFDMRNIDRVVVKELEAAVNEALTNYAGPVTTGSGSPNSTLQIPGMDRFITSGSSNGENGNGAAYSIPGRQ
jgi:hypothetical protein